MELIEIIVIALCVVAVLGTIINGIIKKKKGLSSCGCDCSNCPSHCNSKK